MGRNARRKVEENYSAERYYPRLLGLYERLIEKKRVGKNVRIQVNIKTFSSSPDKELHVIPVQTGIHSFYDMDSRFRGNDSEDKTRTVSLAKRRYRNDKKKSSEDNSSCLPSPPT
jgi:hypothetical protein